MLAQYGARLIGVVYVAFGILGFLPFDWINPMHPEGVGARYLLNQVAINTLHNLIHLAIGISALVAARTPGGARQWGRAGGLVLLVLFGAGIAQAIVEGFPKDQLLFGLVPLNSPGHILHLVSGGLALYLGFARQTIASPPLDRQAERRD
jgi:Domain of unknown function (DUF4383)